MKANPAGLSSAPPGRPPTASAEPGEASAGPAGPGYRLPSWLLIAIPAAAELAVGGYQLGRPSLWRDEGYTLDASQRTTGEIFALLGHQDAVHGPYYLLMHFVIGILGTSAVALRLPSLLTMSLAAAATAVLGRHLARAAGLPAPAATGLLAGLLLVAVPITTWYAQDARPYGLVSLFAVLATYALIRGAEDRRWRWWACYCLAVVLTGMFSLFALLLLAAHGTSLVICSMQKPGNGPTAPGVTVSEHPAGPRHSSLAPRIAPPLAPPLAPRIARWLGPWLAASCAAVAVLTPMLYLTGRQAGTLGWLGRPTMADVTSLVTSFAGARLLVPLVAAIAICGAVADLAVRRGRGLTVAVVAVPWLILPPVILLSVSVLHPVYVQRYVVFCLPALALLSASGVAWLTSQARRTRRGSQSRVLAVLPAAALVVLMAALVAGPQQAIRDGASHGDDLRAVSAVVAARELRGDAVLYLPWDTRSVSMAYPAPFLRLRALQLRESGIRSATLAGLPVSGLVLAGRIGGVSRIWTVQWADQLRYLGSGSLGREEATLLQHMRLIGRWHVQTVVLSLYAVTRSVAG